MKIEKPEGYAIELYFDRQMEKEIFAFRESIYKLGLTPVLGKLGDRPHISLAVFGETDPEKLVRIAGSFIKDKKQFPVKLGAVGFFPTPANVVFLAPVPTHPMLTIHEEFHELLLKEKINSSHYYIPGQWVPHCTLEFELTDDQFNLALQLCKKQFSPFQGTFASMGVIAFRPVEYLAEYPLLIEE
jgi:2'-5' RNA ligase